MSKSLQRADFWVVSPLQLLARVNVKGQTGQNLNMDYTVSWVGPDKWRSEWTGAGYSEVTVLNGGKLYRYRSLATPPLQTLELEKALGMLYGTGPSGPYFPGFVSRNSKVEISKEKINGLETTCVEAPNIPGRGCFDPASLRMLRFDDNIGEFEYADYIDLDGATYPQFVQVSHDKRVLVDAKISLSRTDKLVDSLFEPLSNGTVTIFLSCADLEKNVSPPSLATRVPPDYPQAARQRHHEGTVWLYLLVGKSGAVEQLRVVGHAWPELEDAAAGAVRQWTYTPYMRCGEAVPFETLLTVRYFLRP